MATKEQNTKATTSLANWRFWDQHVQNDMPSGNFINAATVLIAAGPPLISQAAFGLNTTEGNTVTGAAELGANNIAYPVGVVENFGLNQNRMIQKLFEIGSKRSYHIPGRTVGTVSIGRVLFWGPSLMRVLYAYYPSNKMQQGGAGAWPLSRSGQEKEIEGGTPQIKDLAGYGASKEDPNTATPENSDFFINLASDLFDHPMGLMCYLRDAEDEPYGAFYLEDAYIQTHSFNINASSVLVAEGVSCQYDRLVPINITSAVSANSERRAATGTAGGSQ